MGKYDHLKLPRFLEDSEGPHRERVEKRKLDIHGKTAEVVAGYAAARRRMKEIDELKSACQVEIDAFGEVLVLKYEAENISSLKMEDGSSVRVEPSPKPVIQDREAFRQWCVEQGLQKEMHLNPGTTGSMVRNMLIAGRDLPPGVKAFMRDKIVFRKGK